MKHTVGPWFWEQRPYGGIRLYSPKNGSCTVMDFVRMGMQYAQPRFSDRNGQPLGGIMHNADELNLSNHPDARLIAAAPDLLEACKETLRICDLCGDEDKYMDMLRAAIARAEEGI